MYLFQSISYILTAGNESYAKPLLKVKKCDCLWTLPSVMPWFNKLCSSFVCVYVCVCERERERERVFMRVAHM